MAREQAERKLARRRVSKSVIWRQNERRRAEAILLAKKGFVPAELEEKRRPLVLLEEQRRAQAQKIKAELDRADEILKRSLAREIPEARLVGDDCGEDRVGGGEGVAVVDEGVEKTGQELEEDYRRVREEILGKLRSEPYVPRFEWRDAMKAGTRRMRSAGKRRDF